MIYPLHKTRIARIALISLAVSIPALAELDLSGQWANRFHEDWQDRLPGPFIGDYTGIPITDGTRARADAWEESLVTEPQRQCLPHPMPYSLRGPANLRIAPEVDAVTGRLIGWNVAGTYGSLNRTIWLDGRPHPSKYALHTWEGFSTGHWEGDTLATFTDHVKEGYLRRIGIPTSSEATVTEHWTRHGSTMTVTVIVYDPTVLTEPYIRTVDFELDPTQGNMMIQPCVPAVEIPRPFGAVPHVLPGTNRDLDELTKMEGIPFEAARGGAETMYPEYRKKLKDKYVAPAKCERFCCGWVNVIGVAIPPGLNCNQFGFTPAK